MKKRIFKSIFTAAILVFLSCMVFILGALYFQYNREYMRELKAETEIYAKTTEQLGLTYLENINKKNDPRITWIDHNGTVLYDSYTKAEKLEDHRQRPEVKQAFETGYGEEERYSDTLQKKNIYCAVKLEDGSVIRTARGQPTIFAVVIDLLKSMLLILILAVCLSLLFASNLAKKIMQPVNNIDLNNLDDVQVYEEVKPFIKKICEQNEELNRRINRLQTDVDEKTREANFRKEFTANVSHELKTPLTSISGFAEIIKNGIVKPEDIPRFAGKIYDETQRLIRLVEDILKLAQLDEMNVGVKKQKLDLFEVCEEVTELLEPVAEQNKVTLTLEGEHYEIMAVDQILGEIIYNLCDNAIKYNKENGSVKINVFLENGRPAVLVSDTGIGIPKEDLDRVFERFFRVNKSHSKEIGGTGLGLSIVKHGAVYHNAQIRIESKLNQGTDITIIF